MSWDWTTITAIAYLLAWVIFITALFVVPRNRKDGLRGFFWPRTKYEGDDHLTETAEAVREAIARAQADGAG